MDPWLLLQLGDSAYPTGGFAHSAGLEAFAQLGELASQGRERAVYAFCEQSLWQAGFGALPFVAAGHRAPDDLVAHDALSDAFLSNHVTNRASRAQGRAFVSTSARVFTEPRVTALAHAVRSKALNGHHAPLHGAVLATLGASRDDTVRLFLHQGLRGVLSAGVRLGLLGPHEAQSFHRRLVPAMVDVAAECGDLPVDAAAHTAPTIELASASHDALYARLFQS